MGRLGAVIPESCGGAGFAFDGDPGRAGGWTEACRSPRCAGAVAEPGEGSAALAPPRSRRRRRPDPGT